MRKEVLLILALCALISMSFFDIGIEKRAYSEYQTQYELAMSAGVIDTFEPKFAGSFLASRFAQSKYDWQLVANIYKTNQGIQFMISIIPASSNMQIQINFCW